MDYKKCSRCNKNLEVSAFPIDRSSKDGLWRYCRQCESLRQKAKRIKRKLVFPIKYVIDYPAKHKSDFPTNRKNLPFSNIFINKDHWARHIQHMEALMNRCYSIPYLKKYASEKGLLGSHYLGDHTIFLHLKHISESSLVMRTASISEIMRSLGGKCKFCTFEERVAQVITHEVMHALLMEQEGDLTSRKWDNLAPILEEEGYGTA